jgi:hypothetical protein
MVNECAKQCVNTWVGSRDRVVTAPSERVTTGNAANGKGGAAQPAVTDDGDVGVFAAGGKILALRGDEEVQQRGQGALIEGEER